MELNREDEVNKLPSIIPEGGELELEPEGSTDVFNLMEVSGAKVCDMPELLMEVDMACAPLGARPDFGDRFGL